MQSRIAKPGGPRDQRTTGPEDHGTGGPRDQRHQEDRGTRVGKHPEDQEGRRNLAVPGKFLFDAYQVFLMLVKFLFDACQFFFDAYAVVFRGTCHPKFVSILFPASRGPKPPT